jgi:CO/xanthine dehydrogenase FAD-binding subunit
MRLPKFDYFAPTTLESALNLLDEQRERTHLLAGGTDVLVRMTHGRLTPKAIVDIQAIEELNTIHYDDTEGLTIGATARIAQVISHPDVLRNYPALAHAGGVMANVQVRNMGTVVGNLCNAAPSADNAPPLIAMGAEVILVSVRKERRLPLDHFFKGPGLTAIESSEMVKAVRVPPPPPESGTSYKRISARCGVDIAAACVAVSGVFEGGTCKHARVVLGAVAPIPMRATKTETLIQGTSWSAELVQKAGDQAAEEAKPISDVRASAEWRKKMVAVLTRRAMEEALNFAGQR